MTRIRKGTDIGKGGGFDGGGTSGNPRGPFGPEDDIEDPLLRAHLKTLLAGTTAPAPLVHAVERQARLLPTASVHRNPWAEFLPALASVGLVGSLLAGALTSLPIGKGLLQLNEGHGGGSASPLLVLGGLAMPLVAMLTLELLRGAPLFKRLVR